MICLGHLANNLFGHFERKKINFVNTTLAKNSMEKSSGSQKFPRVIALSGKIGSGKDFLMDNVVKKFLESSNFVHLSFADQLKVMLMTKEGLTFEECYVKKTPKSRLLMQKFAEEERKKDSEIWIKYMKNWMTVQASRGVEYVLITDLRYRNEYEFLKSINACIIRIEWWTRTREKILEESGGDPDIFREISEHISETDLDSIKFEEVIQNGDSRFELEECIIPSFHYIFRKYFKEFP